MITENKKYVVLLIEDNEDDASLLRSQLATYNHFLYPITVKRTLKEVFEIPKDVIYDATLIDKNLPDSKGDETIKALINNGQLGALLILTGDEGKENDVISAARLGAQDYIVKGDYKQQQLARALLGAIERHKILKESADLKKDMLSLHTLLQNKKND